MRKHELIRAQNALALARAHLSTPVGISQNVFDPAEGRRRKKSPSNELEEAEKKAMELRPDLKRNRSEQEAQQKSVSVAKSSFGPRVNPFAGWEADNPTFVAGWRE